jgi:tripartite-type tricarboxylate transporter receptor subunit TctC
MVIDNRAGANGSSRRRAVALRLDGYTLFVTTNTTHSANPYLLKNRLRSVKDFTPIARTGDLPLCW